MNYSNNGGNSNVYSYSYVQDKIIVTFNGGATYTYTYDSAGVENIETMKDLADNGQGLNSYINRVVKNKYAQKMA